MTCNTWLTRFNFKLQLVVSIHPNNFGQCWFSPYLYEYTKTLKTPAWDNKAEKGMAHLPTFQATRSTKKTCNSYCKCPWCSWFSSKSLCFPHVFSGLHGDDGLQEPGAVLGAGAALETHHGLNAEKNHPTQALDLDGSGWIWMDLDGSGWIWIDFPNFGGGLLWRCLCCIVVI